MSELRRRRPRIGMDKRSKRTLSARLSFSFLPASSPHWMSSEYGQTSVRSKFECLPSRKTAIINSRLPLLFQVGGLIFVAGQIGLVPGSMELLRHPSLRPGGSSEVLAQAALSLRHVERVLQARGSAGLGDIVQVSFICNVHVLIGLGFWLDFIWTGVLF